MPSYGSTKYADKQKFQSFRSEARQRYYNKTIKYSEGKRRWSDTEKKQVLAQDITDHELAQKIRRSVKAIQTERYKLRKERNDRED